MYCFSCGAQRARVPARGGVTGAGRGRQSAIVTRHCHPPSVIIPRHALTSCHPETMPRIREHLVERDFGHGHGDETVNIVSFSADMQTMIDNVTILVWLRRMLYMYIH